MQVVNPHSGAGFISPTDRVPTLVLGEAQLVRTRLGTGQQVGPELKMKFPSEWPRNEFGLVVAAFAQAGRVKRYWDDDVHGEMFGVACGDFYKPICKPGGEWSDSIVFEEENRADHRFIVISEASSEAEAVRFEAAEAAQKVGRVRDLM